MKRIKNIEENGDVVWTVSWAPCGQYFITSGEEKCVRLYRASFRNKSFSNQVELSSCIDIENPIVSVEKVSDLEEIQNRTIRCIRFSNNGKYIAAASFDSTIVVYAKETQEVEGRMTNVWEIAATLEGHENEVKSIAWSPDDSVLASCSRDKSIWLWEVPTSDDNEIYEDWDCLSVMNGHTQDVKFICFAPKYATNETILVSASYDNSIRIWREGEDDWVCSCVLNLQKDGHLSTVWQVLFLTDIEGSSKDSKEVLFASCSQDISIKVWKFNLETNVSTCLQTLSSENNPIGFHQRTIFCLAFDVKRRLLASAGADDKIIIYNLNDKNNLVIKQVIPKAHESDVNSIVFNPKVSGLLLSGSDDGRISLWL